MLVYLWAAWQLLALVESQGGGAGGPPEQKCVVMLRSNIQVCDDEVSQSYMDTKELYTEVLNESMSNINGFLEFLRPLDPATLIELILYKLSNGKKEMMMTHELKMCEHVGREDGEFWSLFQYMEFPLECPIPAGSYKINNMVIDMDDLPINSANIGPYFALMNYWMCEDNECRERTFECCLHLDFEIEPLE